MPFSILSPEMHRRFSSLRSILSSPRGKGLDLLKRPAAGGSPDGQHGISPSTLGGLRRAGSDEVPVVPESAATEPRRPGPGSCRSARTT